MTARSSSRQRKDSDDLKVLFIGVCIYIMMSITGPVLLNMWDRHVAPRPFIYAELELLRLSDDDRVWLDYHTETHQPVDAVWIASIFDENDHRLYQRRGFGNYPKRPVNQDLWSWDAFFENEYATKAPPVPNVPFRVCVRYLAEARDSGVKDETPVYCSQLFDPSTEE